MFSWKRTEMSLTISGRSTEYKSCLHALNLRVNEESVSTRNVHFHRVKCNGFIFKKKKKKKLKKLKKKYEDACARYKFNKKGKRKIE